MNELNPTKTHRHEFIEQGNQLVCACGVTRLLLRQTEEEGILQGIKADGKKYTVRESRHSYLRPEEWKLFIKEVDYPLHRLFFLSLLHTGARAMEALHLKPSSFDFERKTVKLDVIKGRGAKRNFSAMARERVFFVADNYLKEVKRYISKFEIKENEYFFLNNEELPEDYSKLPKSDKKKHYSKKEVSYNQLLKRKLKKIGGINYKQFSLHNLRKTYGNWMRIFGLRDTELCYRLGHDLNTYFIHYGSPDTFTPQERSMIQNILGGMQ